MNIFQKVALQGLRKSRTRTFVTIIGVVLSAALITSVATFAVSLQSYMIKGAATKYGDWHVQIPDADKTFLEKQSDDSRVQNIVTLQNIGYSFLKGGQNFDKPYLFITGWGKEALETLPIKLLSGRLPMNSGEVVIPAHISANGGVKISIGDTLNLQVGNRIKGEQKLSQHDPYSGGEENLLSTTERTYTVVGICQRPVIEEFTAPGYTLITTEDTATADSLAIFVKLKDPYKINSYLDSFSESNDYVLNENVLRFMGLSEEKAFATLMFTVGGILILLVMLGSVFLIYNSFNISLNERTHQFGILMSVGATEKQLRNSVLFEGICIGIIGIPIGILVGIPSIKLVLSLVAENFSNVMYDNVTLELVVSIPSIIAAAVISMITILISAYIPAKKAAGTPVMECIHQINEIKVDAKAIKTSKFFDGFYGLEEKLALKNFKRNKRRYRSIILSLTLSVILFVSASSFGMYLNQVAKNSTVVEDYDICFDTRDMEEEEMFKLYDEMKTATGVTKSGYQAISKYSCTLNTDELTSHFIEEYGELIGYDGAKDTVDVMLNIQFVEEKIYSNLLKKLDLPTEDYTGKDDKMIMAGILPEHWYTQEQPMNFTLFSKDGSQSKKISATFIEDYPDLLPTEPSDVADYTLLLMAPYEEKPLFDILSATVKPTQLGMTFESNDPGKSTAEMQRIIDESAITADYNLYNLYEILDQNRNIIFIVNLFSTVFIIMISLIAIANVFNTISTNIKLRRRELAMLRSVGMSDKDFNKMMRFECSLYGMRTMLWGLPISAIISCLIYKGMVAGGGSVTFAFPWSSMAISIVTVFLVVFITMIYATGKIKRENIIDGLRDNLT